jgi:hypothetical protein
MKLTNHLIFLSTALTQRLSVVAGFMPSTHGRHKLLVSHHHGLQHASTVREEMPAMTEARELDASNTPLSNSVQFPPPLGKMERLKRAATFWASTAPIVVDYVGLLGHLKVQELHGMALSDHQEEKLWTSKHKEGAQKLADTISEMKGFYVKAAQIIASRGTYILVERIVTLLGSLCVGQHD